jgi:HPt (histidine-containing phosphotransfer) domain-containing protein
VIPGFDLVTVSSWVQHKVERVWNLVEDFVAQEGRTADDLQALLQAQRYDEARLRVHSLMGSAAAVGAKPLAQASAALNMALRAGGEPAQGLRQALDEALRTAIADATAALEGRRR